MAQIPIADGVWARSTIAQTECMLLDTCEKDISDWRYSWLTARSHAAAADAMMEQTQLHC